MGVKNATRQNYMTKSWGFMFCIYLCEIRDRKELRDSHHLTETGHEPAQLYQRTHSFQNPHVCKADFLKVT